MNGQYFRLKCSPELEAELRPRVRAALRRRKKKDPDYKSRWTLAAQTGLQKLSFLKGAEFRVLKRQFEKGNTLLLPVAVRAARRLVNFKNDWKKRKSEC